MANKTIIIGSSPQQNRNRRNQRDREGTDLGNGSASSFNMISTVYRGRADRQQQYRRYDQMMKDTDVARAIDMIAEHCCEPDKDGRFFQFNWRSDQASDDISKNLMSCLDQWQELQAFDTNRLWYCVRNTLIYGDWFLFRNPDTLELYDIPPNLVLGAIIDRETGDICGWLIRNFRWNVQTMEIDIPTDGSMGGLASNLNTVSGGMRNVRAIPAQHIVQLSMADGRFRKAITTELSGNQINTQYPFGESFLESIAKTFMQRDLIEEAAIIARVQRAPTRLVWYVDVGRNRSDRANYLVDNFKNEMTQKRIPQFISQNSESVHMDSIYNPIGQLEDYYIPVSMDQRGSKVEKLEGTPWTEIPELEYLREKILGGLRVPYAWMIPASKGGTPFTDGKAGVAYQEEIEFSRVCKRIQNMLHRSFDREFKMYCEWRDVDFNPADFKLKFNPPDNYEDSKRLARMSEAIGVWSQIKGEPYLSKRWTMQNIMGMTDDQVLENERLWREENKNLKVGMGVNPDNNMSFAGGGFDMGSPMGMGNPMGDLTGTDQNPLGQELTGGGTATSPISGASMGGTPVGGGMGESKMQKPQKVLMEDVEYDPKALPKPRGSGGTSDTDKANWNDQSMQRDDVGESGFPHITLEMLMSVRRAHFAKRLDKQRRLNRLGSQYGQPSGEGGGGLGGF